MVAATLIITFAVRKLQNCTLNLMSAKENLLAAWRFCLSFTKRKWELRNYPVVIRKQETPRRGPSASERPPLPYAARIVNWWVMTGLGNTPEEAMNELAGQFSQMKDNRHREGKPMPRPGTNVPIEFAPSDGVYAHPDLTDDFIRRVLGLDWAFVSDQSSLWDFHEGQTNEALIAKIKELYGVDVSDIESGHLATILDRIATARNYRMYFNDAAMVEAAREVFGKPMRLNVTVADGDDPGAALPPAVPPAEEARERALANPEVRRFQEVFEGSTIYKVRNLKE